MPSDRPESVKDITWQLVNNDPGKVATIVLTRCYFAYGYHKLQVKTENVKQSKAKKIQNCVTSFMDDPKGKNIQVDFLCVSRELSREPVSEILTCDKRDVDGQVLKFQINWLKIAFRKYH
jgi:hypothetical protein